MKTTRIHGNVNEPKVTDPRIYDEQISKIPVKLECDLLEVSQNLTKAELQQWLSDVTGYKVTLKEVK